MAQEWLKILAACMLAGLALEAQIGRPVPVHYDVVGTADPSTLGSIKRIVWGNPGDQWSASFGFPRGWVDSERWAGPKPSLHLDVLAPDGGAQRISLPFDRHRYALEDVNGEFIGSVKWGSPHMTSPGLHDVHYAEQAVFGDWEVRRVIWRVGGCSGNPPMYFLLVVRHLRTGQWVVCQDEFQYPPAPDGGEPMRATTQADGSLGISFWNYEGRNSAIFSGWTFSSDSGGEVRCKRDKPRYCLYTRTGAVATLADTPREAIHSGYQEVAWHVASWDGNGGVARAFSSSPRRPAMEDDRAGAPILPREGRLRFLWAAEIYVVPWRGKPMRMKLAEALALTRKGRWDVVLFQLSGNRALAQRLVEHKRDFPHSTPK